MAPPMLPDIPQALTLEQLREYIPQIPPVPADSARPFWSVMIPAYNRVTYLEQTLQSVLQQDPGPDQMQIAVVDNASTEGNVQEVVQKVGKGRVEYYRNPRNLGSVPNHNMCVRHSRGHWVQILHDDDVVMPGYYEAYRQTIERHDEVITVAGKAIHFDQQGRWQRIVGEDPNGGGLIEDFSQRARETNRLIVSATAVKRAAYERIGGWCEIYELLAWDMWIRLAAAGPAAGTCRPYLLYRRYPESEWGRGMLTTARIREGYQITVAGCERIHGSPLDSKLLRQCRSRWAAHAINLGRQCHKKGMLQSRMDFARYAWKLERSRKTAKFLVKSWAAWLPKRWSSRKTGFGPPPVSAAPSSVGR